MSDYQSYRDAYFVDPPPQPRYDYTGIRGITLYYQEYDEAISYYRRALGPPSYIEGPDTHGWRIGNTWLTLLRTSDGNPRNLEIQIVVNSSTEAEELQAAMIEAGGVGDPPSDQLMYEPLRYCPVRDPFGVDILITSPKHTDYE